MWRVSFWSFLLVLLYFTLTPVPPKPIGLNQIDKFYHFVSFAVLGFTFLMAYSGLAVKTVIYTSISIGVGIEVLQYFIPNRGFSIADMLADALGVIAGVWIGKWLLKSKS